MPLPAGLFTQTEGSYVSGNHPIAEGITNPPIDELLKKSDSKYKLVLVRSQARSPNQRLLLPAGRRSA